MEESYSTRLVFKSTPGQVSKLMRLDETRSEAWHSDDVAAMVRHQLAAPLELDLDVSRDTEQKRDAGSSDGGPAQPELRTFGDLFRAACPPLDLLQRSQRFFKQQLAERAKNSPDRKVSYLFYLLSIVVARMRAGARISTLSNAELIHSLQSLAQKNWVDPQIRNLLLEALNHIKQEPPAGGG
jgi:hypothetical protein